MTEWRFQPGTATGRHRHEYDYVVVPMTTGSLVLRDGEGDRTVGITAGQAYFRNAGVDHDVINESAETVAFIEIELKPR